MAEHNKPILKEIQFITGIFFMLLPALRECNFFYIRKYIFYINISPTLLIDISMEMSSRVIHGNPKNNFINTYLNVSVMFCKQFLAYTVHIDWCYHSINKHLCRFQHIYIYICVNFMHLYDDLWGCIDVPSRVDI